MTTNDPAQKRNVSTPMPEISMQAMRPRARLMLTIGLELISSETVALTELVKNFDER